MNNEEPNLRIICKNKQCKACYHKNCINEWAKTKGTNDISETFRFNIGTSF